MKITITKSFINSQKKINEKSESLNQPFINPLQKFNFQFKNLPLSTLPNYLKALN